MSSPPQPLLVVGAVILGGERLLAARRAARHGPPPREDSRARPNRNPCGRTDVERRRPSARSQLQACIAACKACGDECDQHAGMHEHCKVCAQACRACEQACSALLESIS